jgi:hypothetical protein
MEKCFLKLAMISCLATTSSLALADWINFIPERIQVLPIGNLALWSSLTASTTNGCGTAQKPFRVEVNMYGVTVEGVKQMQAVVMAASLASKSIDISYYPNDLCRVDSMTLHIN